MRLPKPRAGKPQSGPSTRSIRHNAPLEQQFPELFKYEGLKLRQDEHDEQNDNGTILTAGKDHATVDPLQQQQQYIDPTNENTTQFQNEEGEILDMQTANLLEFGQGGGLFGDDRDVIMTNWRVAEHSFEKLAADKKTVVEKYPPGCHVLVDIYAEDRTEGEPEFVTQVYPVGDLPAARMIELGFQPRTPGPGQKPQLGGYRPSVDGENPAAEGPFVVLEGRNDIWNGCPYAQLMDEVKQLLGASGQVAVAADRLAAQGLAALNGLRCHLGTKALPKSKRTQQEEKLTGQEKQARSILVPVRVNAWPWDAQNNTAQTQNGAAPKPVAVQQTAAAAAVQQQAAVPAPAPGNGAAQGSGNGTVAADDKIAEYVVKAIQNKGGFIPKTELGVAIMPLLAKEGANRMPYMQRAHQDDFLTAYSGKSWVYDQATGMLAQMQ